MLCMVMVVEMKTVSFSTVPTTLRSFVLVVDDTVDGKGNQMEETMDVGDIMTYNFSQDVLLCGRGCDKLC